MASILPLSRLTSGPMSWNGGWAGTASRELSAFQKIVLQTLRDQLPVNEATDLGAQLPTLIRGIYYDQWRPVHYFSVKDRHPESFLDRIDSAFEPDAIDDTPEAVSAVFAMLSAKISIGEITDDRILHVAKSEEVDVVISGAQGLSDISALVLGGVSHELSHLAPMTCVAVR